MKNKNNTIIKNNLSHSTREVNSNSCQFYFIPAFYDALSHTVFLSCYKSGQLAPIHVLEGIPDNIIKNRTLTNNRGESKNSLIIGFIFKNKFLTRKQAINTLSTLS